MGNHAGDYGSRLARHDAELAELRKAVAGMGERMDAGFEKLTTAVHDLRSQSGPPVATMVDMGVKVAGLFAALVAGILYLAGSSNAVELRELDKRISRIETVMSVATARRVPAARAWVPGLASR